MKKFFRKIGNAFARMMYGRYGTDEFSFVLMLFALVLVLLSYIPTVGWIFSILSLTVMLFSVFRTFSKNIPRRRRELERYLRIKHAPQKARQLRKNKKRDKKTHLYFKCPDCKAVLRVPRGKGEILVTCPRCGTKTPKKT